MSSPLPQVVTYGYSESSMWRKVWHVLLLRRIPYSMVNVKDIPPRPELLQLGISYRRVPVVFIGGEVFFDTNLIFQELERRFKPEDGFPSLLSVTPGLQAIASNFWVDRVLFQLFFTLFNPALLTPVLLDDRAEFNPAPSYEALEGLRPYSSSDIRAHLSLLNRQLESSATKYLLSTPSPSLIDVTTYTLIAWLRAWKNSDTLLVLPSSQAPLEFRRVMEWFEAVREAIHAAMDDAFNPAAKPPQLNGEEAARLIMSTPSQPSQIQLAVDPSDPLVIAKLIEGGGQVTVTPTDTWKVPQSGRVVGLTAERVSISIQVPDSERAIIGHFPRLGYKIEKIQGAKDAVAKL